MSYGTEGDIVPVMKKRKMKRPMKKTKRKGKK